MVSSIVTATLEVSRSSAAVLDPSARRTLAALLPCALIVSASGLTRAFTRIAWVSEPAHGFGRHSDNNASILDGPHILIVFA
eukprot:scaffold311823_cov75-Attheya_sp.AAC.1